MDGFDILFLVIFLASAGASIARSVRKGAGTAPTRSENETEEVSFEPIFVEEDDVQDAFVQEDEGIPVVHETAASRAGQWRSETSSAAEAVDEVLQENSDCSLKRHPVALDKEKLIVYSEIMKPKFDDF